jgi:hypothetical protein
MTRGPWVVADGYRNTGVAVFLDRERQKGDAAVTIGAECERLRLDSRRYSASSHFSAR